jgi:hypothetical protein
MVMDTNLRIIASLANRGKNKEEELKILASIVQYPYDYTATPLNFYNTVKFLRLNTSFLILILILILIKLYL